MHGILWHALVDGEVKALLYFDTTSQTVVSSAVYYPANMTESWPRSKCIENPVSQQTQNICITFVQCWTNVEDVGPTLYKCYTDVLCSQGYQFFLF